LLPALLLLAACGGAPQQSLSRVDDQADLIAPAVEVQLTSQLEALERATSDQVQVMTVPSLEGKSIEQVAIGIARKEALGMKGKDNGVLLLIAPQERKLRIETGRGIAGALSDAEAGRITKAMTQNFRAGRMEQGIVQGVTSIDRELRENPVRPALLRKDEPWPA
jgi:uncharacterized protein